MIPVRPKRITRRRFLQAGLGVGLGILGWGWFGHNVLRLEERTLRLPGVPAALSGLRIALLADLHAGHYAQDGLAEQVVALANRARPDLVLLGGDLIHNRTALTELPAVQAALAQLRAPLGVFAVLGNHDYWAGARAVSEALTAAGVTVLVNAGRRLAFGAGELWLAGLDSLWAGRPDIRRAMQGAPAGAYSIVLVHEPDFADALAASGAPVGLQLSGHSHGGQVRIPGVGALVLPPFGRKYPIGLQPVPGASFPVYTSRGIGVSGPPLRILCPPEVSVLQLVPGQPL